MDRCIEMLHSCSLTLCCSLMACWWKWRTKSAVVALMYFRSYVVCVCVCSDLKLRVRILIDGTLIIYRVKPEDAGKYTCSPSNSLGISPSASAYLTVQCECCYGEQRGGAVRERWSSSSSTKLVPVLFGFLLLRRPHVKWPYWISRSHIMKKQP